MIHTGAMDEEGCFDVCASEPEPVELDCFALWLDGLTLAHAARRRATEMSNLVRHANLHDNSSPSESPIISTTAATAALNSGDSEKLLTASLAKALGVRSEILDPISEMLDALEAQVQGGGMDDATWLQFVAEAADSIPELFAPEEAAALAADLEAAMGTSVLIGVRDQIQESRNQKDS